MEVKMNGQTSTPYHLIGGGPQGSLIGQLFYIIASDDAAEDVPEEDNNKYIDDLSVLEAVNIKGKLADYDILHHVTSDLATGQHFLTQSTLKTQKYNNYI